MAVTDLGALKQTAENLASKVLVVGADRPTADGKSVPLEAVAPVVTDRVDWNGNPVNRTLVVTDSTVANKTYAAALAADQANRNANPAQTITVTLSGDVDRGAPPGDWVYPYKPESGLTDPANACEVEGTTVYPARKRVLVRRRELLAGRIDIRLPDGTALPLTGVTWSGADITTMELGEFVQPFDPNPAAGNIGRQFLRRIASMPR